MTFTKTQKIFFAGFSDFDVTNVDDPAGEFRRLADLKKWDSATSDLFRHLFFAADVADEETKEFSSGRQQQPMLGDSFQPRKAHSVPISLVESLQRLAIEPPKIADISTPGALQSPTQSTTGDGVYIRYFDCFPGFTTDHKAPLLQEFKRLAAYQKWTKRSETYRNQFARCCDDELRFFQSEGLSKLEMYQKLVKELLKTDVEPSSIKQCKMALRSVHVNIFDYIDCKRRGTEIQPIFSTKASFMKATMRGNRFPRENAKRSSMVSALLEKVS